MSECCNEYIQIIREHLAASVELDITADDYIHELEEIYGERHSKNITKFYRHVKSEMPEIPNDILYKIIRERIDKWDELLLEQMTHLSEFTLRIFRVPRNCLLETNKRLHDSIESYSVKEEKELDRKIEEAHQKIINKQAYLSLLTKQAEKIQLQKNAVLDRKYC